MKFSINVQHFKKQLKPILQGSNHQEVVWFNADEEGIKFSITHGHVTALLNLKSKIHQDLQYVCQERGFGAVNAKSLEWSLKSFLPNETISLEFPSHMCIKLLTFEY